METGRKYFLNTHTTVSFFQPKVRRNCQKLNSLRKKRCKHISTGTICHHNQMEYCTVPFLWMCLVSFIVFYCVRPNWKLVYQCKRKYTGFFKKFHMLLLQPCKGNTTSKSQSPLKVNHFLAYSMAHFADFLRVEGMKAEPINSSVSIVLWRFLSLGWQCYHWYVLKSGHIYAWSDTWVN